MHSDNYWTRHSIIGRRALLRGAGAAAVGTAGLGLVGCGDDDDGTPSGSTPSGGSTAAGGATAAATAAGTPKVGGTWRWDITSIPYRAFIDPHVAGSTGSGVGMFLWNTAVRWNAPASKMTGELFESWETTDGQTYVVKVRKGVKTQNLPLTNGRVFDAEDAAQNLLRQSGLLDPQNAATYTLRGGLPNLESAKSVDATTVQVKFTKPTPFPEGLTNYTAWFLPKENWANPDTLKTPMKVSGTGPWILTEYNPDQGASFKRNPDYWEGTSPIENVQIRIPGDRVSQMSSFIQGASMYFEGPSKVERETIAKSVNGSQLFSWPGSSANYQAFNVKKAPFTDVRVRQAIHLAINFQKNLEDYWGTGFWTVAGVLNNAFAQAYQPDDVLKMPGWRSDKAADLKTANDLLTAAGFPQGQGLAFEFSSVNNPLLVPNGYDFATRCLDNWKQAFPKIDVKFKLLPDQVSLVNAGRTHDFQMIHAVNVSAAPASVDLDQRYRTGGALNYADYSSQQIDGLLTKAVSSRDNAEISTLMKQAQDILLKDLPMYVTHRTHQAGIWGATMRGFPTLPDGTTPIKGNFENWNSAVRHVRAMWIA